MTSDRAPIDVLVIGGGPAGLSGAVSLGRSRRSVTVVDGGEPRNRFAEHMHGYLGHEGLSPLRLLELGRAEAEKYGVEILRDRVATVKGRAGNFAVSLESGTLLTARRILVATGLTDELPDIPGVQELWGKSVIHCPYCHGWEVRDQEIAVIATGPGSLHQAHMFRQLSPSIALALHHFAPDDEANRKLKAAGIQVLEGPVLELERAPDGAMIGLRLEGDRRHAASVAVVAPRMIAQTPFLADLGLEPISKHDGLIELIESDNIGATSVPGVFAAGNVTDSVANVIAAASQGTFAGAHINADLVNDDLAAALKP